MPQPYALLRAGFPYLKTVGVKNVIDDPLDVAFGEDGRVYVLGSAPIRITNIDHEDLGTIGDRSFGVDYGSNGEAISVPEGELFMPVQVILDREDNLYVSDEACHTVSIFSKEGDFLGRWGEYGTEDGQLNRPAGIAFDADENLYVVDTMNHRVQQFTKGGQFPEGMGQFRHRRGGVQHAVGASPSTMTATCISPTGATTGCRSSRPTASSSSSSEGRHRQGRVRAPRGHRRRPRL